jgi:3-methyl-2-oxobutanoate hydroxymethyltransferase
VDAAKLTVPDLARRKSAGDKLVMITCYDATFAGLLEEAGVDLLLVGDSLGMVVQGQSTTLPVTLDEMIYHCRMVSRGASRALVVGDLPFGTYQQGTAVAMESAVRMVKEGGVAMVKLEGGVPMAPTIEAVTSVDIPVMAHIGLTPQSYHRMGGHKVQGREHGRGAGQWERLLDDARAVEDAGAFAVVLEGMPRDLAAEITKELQIPTIGIGAGPDCDGQVLVLHDVIGLAAPRLKFTKQYGDVGSQVVAAAAAYADDVRTGAFPDDAHSFH